MHIASDCAGVDLSCGLQIIYIWKRQNPMKVTMFFVSGILTTYPSFILVAFFEASPSQSSP
jgi:hypothetical protein